MTKPKEIRKSKRNKKTTTEEIELEESLLLGADEITPVSSQKRRATLSTSSQQEAELLEEDVELAPDTPIVHTKRRKSRSGTAKKYKVDNSLDISFGAGHINSLVSGSQNIELQKSSEQDGLYSSDKKSEVPLPPSEKDQYNKQDTVKYDMVSTNHVTNTDSSSSIVPVKERTPLNTESSKVTSVENIELSKDAITVVSKEDTNVVSKEVINVVSKDNSTVTKDDFVVNTKSDNINVAKNNKMIPKNDDSIVKNDIVNNDTVIEKNHTADTKNDTVITKKHTLDTKNDTEGSKSDTVDTTNDTVDTKSDTVATETDTVATETDTLATENDTVFAAPAFVRPPTEEVDIYSNLSADNNFDHTTSTENTGGDEITYDDVFKATAEQQQIDKKQKAEKSRLSTSDNLDEEDLDYEGEEDTKPQMRISVLVSKSGSDAAHHDKHRRTAVRQEISNSDKQRTAPVILPPLPQHISIPPMLPLPPVLPPLPQHQQYNPSIQRLNIKKKVYINPKFKTEVILRNLERAGILKGGNVAVHINRRGHPTSRGRSRSPIRCHQQEYIPSPIANKHKAELDEPTTTLLITDLSVCTTRTRIKQLFSSIGNVKEVLTYPQERRAVVTFQYAKDAVICRRKFHRSMVDGSMMSVNFAI